MQTSFTQGQLAEIHAGVFSGLKKGIVFNGTEQRGAIAAAASLTTALAGSNNDLTLTAVATGAAGNDITIEYVKPKTNGLPLLVQLDSSNRNHIRVSLVTSPGVLAAPTTSLTGTHNDLVFTSKIAGEAGNDITVAYVDPAGNDEELEISVVGNAITVSLATDGDGVITSTANQVLAAIGENEDADALVSVALAAANNGSGVVTVLSATNLTGGISAGTITTTAAQVDAAIDANPAAAALVTPANAGGNNGTGLVTEMAPTKLSGGTSGTIELYEVIQDGLISVIAKCTKDLAGASATIEVGIANDSDALIDTVTATDVDAGEFLDISGIVATPPDAAVHLPVYAGQKIFATIGTAPITAGELEFSLFYQAFPSAYVPDVE